MLGAPWVLRELGSYTWAQSRNTGTHYAGNVLPGVPRHTAVLANVGGTVDVI